MADRIRGALYHILSRGNEQGDIFYDNTDRGWFLDTLKELSERFAVDIFAYVLIDNHYHLLLKTRHANLSKAMQWFRTTYTRRFNNRHNRSGHLFQGRFKRIIYLIWQTGLVTSEKIGAIIDLTYSSVSHGVKAVKPKMAKEHKFKDYLEDLNSQFKV